MLEKPLTDAKLLERARYFFQQPEVHPAMTELLDTNRDEAQRAIQNELERIAIALCDARDHPKYREAMMLARERGLHDHETTWKYFTYIHNLGSTYGVTLPQVQKPGVYLPPSTPHHEQDIRLVMKETGWRYQGYDISEKPRCDAELLYNLYFGFLKQSEEMISVTHQLLGLHPCEGKYYLKLDVEKAEEIMKTGNKKACDKATRYFNYLCDYFWDVDERNLKR